MVDISKYCYSTCTKQSKKHAVYVCVCRFICTCGCFILMESDRSTKNAEKDTLHRNSKTICMSLSERSKQNMTCVWWRDVVSKHSSNTFLVVGHQICTQDGPLLFTELSKLFRFLTLACCFFVAGVVCFRSCWKTYLQSGVNVVAESSQFSSRILWHLDPRCSEVILYQSIMIPPPCFTIGMCNFM